MSPWNLTGSNRIVTKTVKETKLKERWRKMPQGKPQEWTEAMIMGTYKLKNEAHKLETGRGYTDLFFTHTFNVGNDGYKLNDF